MGNEFMNWTTLMEYSTFVTVVFMIVEFSKEMPLINKIKTKYYSFLVALTLLTLVQLHAQTFEYWDVVLYVLSSMIISLSANGLSNFNSDKVDTVVEEDVVEEVEE